MTAEAPKVQDEVAKAIDAEVKAETKLFILGMVIMQIVVVVVLAIANIGYPEELDFSRYGYFRDVNIMIFIGFGYLMTFLRRYGYSAVGYTMIISALCVEWSMAFLFFMHPDMHGIGILQLFEGLFSSAAVMISFGAVLGKTTPLQLLVMAVIEVAVFFVNFKVATKIGFHDVGGGMTIHAFGCYFGLAATWWLTFPDSKEHKDESAVVSSDLFSLIGTTFLWVLWPSFNAAIAADGFAEQRALTNTFLSLCGCVIGFAITSRFFGHGKLDAVHLQNASLAGGVAMGVVADLPIGPPFVMAIGFFAGVLSTVGYAKITPFLCDRFGIQDICGVNNLHGMPGIYSAIVGAVTIGVLASDGAHKAFAAAESSANVEENWPVLAMSAGTAVGKQFLVLAVSLGFAIAGGFLTGFVMYKMRGICALTKQEYFNDRVFWEVPSDYDLSVNKDEERKPDEQVCV